jgi:hypothetical protein
MTMSKRNIIGVYSDEEVFAEAIRKVKEKGIPIRNVFMPFPVHKVFDLMNLKTRLPYATFFYAFLGVSITFGFLYWASVINYPLKFGGKPMNSLSFIIIMFVMTINIAVLFTFVSFFLRQKLGPGKKAVMIDSRSIDDKFLIVIARDTEMNETDAARIKTLLKETGASEVNEQPEPDDFKEEND